LYSSDEEISTDGFIQNCSDFVNALHGNSAGNYALMKGMRRMRGALLKRQRGLQANFLVTDKTISNYDRNNI